MTDYKRADFEGGYYFFTVVTCQRQRLFAEQRARRCLRTAIRKTKGRYPYETIAFCLLPDHMHCVWKLPEDDADFSMRWALTKSSFTRMYLDCGGCERPVSRSRASKRERGIWQRRFWEHQIRDEKDLQRHVDYVHFNPVKHALVEKVEDWPWSTYHRYAASGYYGQRSWDEITRDLDDLAAGE